MEPSASELALVLNIKTFGLAVLTVVALLIAVSLLYRHPTRPVISATGASAWTSASAATAAMTSVRSG